MTARTETDMLALLRKLYMPQRGNGDEWAFLPHVRNAAGFDASRTIDLLIMGLWPSRGLTVIGHEIKCSRSDWLRELANPAKAEAFHTVVDGWYLVVSDESIVEPGELPETWGLIAPSTYRGKEKLKVVKPAPMKLKAARSDTFSRSFVAALLKNACRVMEATPEEIATAVAEVRASAARERDSLKELYAEEAADLRRCIAEFESAAGVQISRWYADGTPTAVGAALRTVLQADEAPDRARRQLQNIAEQARRVANVAEEALAQTEQAAAA